MPPKSRKRARNPKEAKAEEASDGVPESDVSGKQSAKARAPAKKKKGGPGAKKAVEEKKPAEVNPDNGGEGEGEEEGKEESVAEPPSTKRKKTGANSTASKPDSKTDWSKDFSSDAKNKDGCQWNKKFSSWNVNGIRAWFKNGGFEYIKKEDPDIFCLQETKCSEEDRPKEAEVEGYHSYWSSADKKGYSGTGMYCKEKPIAVTYGIGHAEHDSEGRVITAEFEKYYFLTAYVPNAGEKVKRLDYRQKWDVDFRAYLKKLDSVKPVILCGDLNVAHNEIDLANPKSNKNTAGFTKEERDGFSALLQEGFLDTFRVLYPDRVDAYTYWTYRMNARAKNKGWRLDYFVISERLREIVCDCIIRSGVYGSDHCPLVLLMATS